MKNLTALIAFVVLALVSSSCTKTIEFDGEVKKSKLVINSLFNTEDTFKIRLSNSLSLVDDGDLKPIKEAVVKVYDESDNLVATPLHSKDGLFMAPEFQPQLGTNYRVTAESAGYDNVEANDRVPNKVDIIKVDTQRVTVEAGYSEMRLRVNFEDPENESNYYMIQVLNVYEVKIDTSTVEYYDNVWMNTTDPNVEGANGVDGAWGERLILTDKKIDGKKYEFVLNMDTWPFDYEEGNVRLRLFSLSEAAYNYFVSLDQYQRTRDNPFATPVQVFSNVDKGFGIFGGAAISEIPLKNN